MARFSVYKNADGTDFLLDVQSDILGGLSTRVVVPLVHIDNAPKRATYLNPVFEVNDEPYLMLTQFIAAIPESELSEVVGELNDFHSEILAALDMLFKGF